MTSDWHHDHDELAERTTRLLSHLDGALDATMLDSMQGAWSMLEGAATEPYAHARAVRARLFWESMSPGAYTASAVPSPAVLDLVPRWDDSEVAEAEGELVEAGSDDEFDDLAQAEAA